MFLIVKQISRPGKNYLIKVSWATWIYSTYVSIGEKMCESGNRVMQALGTNFYFYFIFAGCHKDKLYLIPMEWKRKWEKLIPPFMLHINKTLNMYALCQGDVHVPIWISTIPERKERKLF